MTYPANRLLILESLPVSSGPLSVIETKYQMDFSNLIFQISNLMSIYSANLNVSP